MDHFRTIHRIAEMQQYIAVWNLIFNQTDPKSDSYGLQSRVKYLDLEWYESKRKICVFWKMLPLPIVSYLVLWWAILAMHYQNPLYKVNVIQKFLQISSHEEYWSKLRKLLSLITFSKTGLFRILWWNFIQLWLQLSSSSLETPKKWSV